MVMMQMYGENQIKKQTKTKIFYCNLESKTLFSHLPHHCKNSHQIISEHDKTYIYFFRFFKKSERHARGAVPIAAFDSYLPTGNLCYRKLPITSKKRCQKIIYFGFCPIFISHYYIISQISQNILFWEVFPKLLNAKSLNLSSSLDQSI